ncbi:MAG TPA: PEP-CTERM sorting domain-containing protein [Bryobacteraceae bacterium]|nr:hypothetical protein [Bryobacterales bacterium]HRJ19050.1 PEP-CTERM sorting domain-containing protein [Bryobacteraceae bacterium]
MIEMLHGFLRPAKRIALAGALLMAMSVAPAAASTVIFDTFGPGTTFNSSVGLTIGFDETNRMAAVPFSSPTDFQLDYIMLPMTYISGTNGFRVRIFTEFGGLPSSQVINWSAANVLPVDETPAIVTLTDAFQTTFEGGKTYFLAVETLVTPSWLSWHLSTTTTGTYLTRIEGGEWQQSADSQFISAFRIVALGDDVGSEIPEPGTWALMGAGLAGLAWLRRKRA